uniref:hypothetical protein n=2 Tax=Vibrio cholerae TaxID=666 RepID=UPI0019629EE0
FSGMRCQPLRRALYYSEELVSMSIEEMWGNRAEIATVFAAVVALFSWFTASRSHKIAKQSLKVAKEAKDIAKKELEAKADDFDVKLLDSKRVSNSDARLVVIYVELINRSSVSNSFTKCNISAHLHFSDDTEQAIEIEEYMSEELSSNVWNNASQLHFPLSFCERQAQKGYIVARLPNVVTKSDYIKKLTLELTSSQDKVYSIDCYGL